MAEMSAEAVQQRIQIARRDAETMKDRIKRRKDELADTTRMSYIHSHSPLIDASFFFFFCLRSCTYPFFEVNHSPCSVH